MDLFAKPITEEEIKFQEWQQTENERLQKEQAEFLAKRIELMNSMTKDKWEDFLQAEAIQNAKDRSVTTKQYELR